MDNVLGRKNVSIKRHAINVILCSELYSLDEIYNTYSSVNTDNRLSVNTRNALLKELKRVYKERKERLYN